MRSSFSLIINLFISHKSAKRNWIVFRNDWSPIYMSLLPPTRKRPVKRFVCEESHDTYTNHKKHCISSFSSAKVASQSRSRNEIGICFERVKDSYVECFSFLPFFGEMHISMMRDPLRNRNEFCNTGQLSLRTFNQLFSTIGFSFFTTEKKKICWQKAEEALCG